MVWEDKSSDSRAQIVADRVCNTIEESGLECEEFEETCPDKSCLKERFASSAFDEAVTVSVEQTGAEYEFQLFLAKGTSAVAEITGPMEVALEKLAGLVKSAVVEPLRKDIAEDASSVVEDADPGEEEPGASLDDTDQSKRSKIRPAPFWAVLGVTSAAIVSWAVVEGVGYGRLKKHNDLEPEERSQSEIDRLKTLRIVDWALMGISGAGLAAMVTLAAFTDFKKDKEDQNARIDLFPGPRGAALVLTAEF
jgi:hypothetical protein